MDGKKINLITPPIEYGGDEESDNPCMCSECGQLTSKTKPKPERQWPDTKIKIDDED